MIRIIILLKGSLCGLYSDNAVECALIDEVLDSVEDVMNLFSPSGRIKDEEKKKAARLVLMNDNLPYWFKKFESRFEENEKRGNKNGFIAGDKVNISFIIFNFNLILFL